MVKYSSKDFKLTVDGNEIYCDTVSLSHSSSFDPELNIKSKNTSRHVANGPLQGEFAMSYYLTGADPLLDIVNEKKAHNVNLGGMYSSNCYLTTYSFSSTPFGTLKATATFIFFGALQGTFSPNFSQLDNDIEVLNTSNVDIVGGTIVKEDKLAEITYNYEVGIEPQWVVDDGSAGGSSLFSALDAALADDTSRATFKGVVASTQRQKLSLKIYDLDLSLLEDGLMEKYTINLNNKNGVTQQSFNINSVILTKSIDVSSENSQATVVSLDMGQANISHAEGEEPSITSISATEGPVGSSVTVVGEKFINVEKVLLGEFPCQITNIFVPPDPANAYTLSFDVSTDIYSGYSAPVHLITRGAEAISLARFKTTNGLIF